MAAASPEGATSATFADVSLKVAATPSDQTAPASPTVASSATPASASNAATSTAATSTASDAAPAPNPGTPDPSFHAGPRYEGGGLSQLLRRTPGTFSGLGLQPAVEWLLHGGEEADVAAAAAGGAGREDGRLRDYAGTTVQSLAGVRNSWEIWKEKMDEAELAHEVANFLAKREDTLAQEERWRNKMMRRLGDKFEHVDARLERMGERFEQLAATCAEIKESVRSLHDRTTFP